MELPVDVCCLDERKVNSHCFVAGALHLLVKSSVGMEMQSGCLQLAHKDRT